MLKHHGSVSAHSVDGHLGAWCGCPRSPWSPGGLAGRQAHSEADWLL